MHSTENVPARRGRPLRILARDGYPLAAHVFEPERDAGVTAIVQPALAVSQRFYSRFAEHLAASGVRVYTFDYRGAGESRLSGELPEATLESWARWDAPAVFEHVRARRPGRLVLVAHSIGGQILGFSDSTVRPMRSSSSLRSSGTTASSRVSDASSSPRSGMSSSPR